MKQHGIRPLIDFYNRMEKSNAYHTIAGLLLQNITKISGMMIHEVANICFTSEATISRLVKKAGYESFNDLREQVSNDCANYFNTNRILEPKLLVGKSGLQEYLSTMIELLSDMKNTVSDEKVLQAAEMIHKATHINYFGNCESFNRIEQDLFVAGKHVDVFQVLPDNTDFMRDWNENVLVIVDNPGYPWFNSNHVVYKCKAAGARVLMITCTKDEEVEKTADLTIMLPGTKSGKDETLFSMFINVLSVEYRRNYLDQWYYK